jgi:uracil-DNA glycosylase family 4
MAIMTFIEKIRKCKKCNIRFHKPLVLGDIENNKFVFLSEEPTRDARDNDFYEYYLGTRKERFHNEWMPKLGINEDWLKNNAYITHVYKCCSEVKKPERDKKCAQCLTWLQKEKEYFRNGKIIITFGRYALESLRPVDYDPQKITEIIKEKKTFSFAKSDIIPLLHPSRANNGPINECREEIEYILRKIRNLIHNQLSM